MSIAIQITTHAPASAVDEVEDEIVAIAKRLDEAAKAAADPDDGEPPATVARVFGTDYTGKKPKAVERKLA